MTVRSVLVLLVLAGGLEESLTDEVFVESKCFGNLDPVSLTTLYLSCAGGHVIQVMSVSHGVKPSRDRCDSPARTDTYRPQCCVYAEGDCVIPYTIDIMAPCNGLRSCDVRTNWQLTHGYCADGKYNISTNYMQAEWVCLTPASTPSTTQESKTTPSTSTHQSTKPLPSDVTSSRTTKPVTSDTDQMTSSTPVAPTVTQSSVSDDDELSSGMVTAIIGASVGMVLIIVVFACYTGRRRHLRIEGKPQPSVWDFLLPSAFTVRGERGYDHFNNRRSVNSTTSSEGSTYGGGRSNWQPNIAPGPEMREEDAASVYDNNENIYSSIGGNSSNVNTNSTSNTNNTSNSNSNNTNSNSNNGQREAADASREMLNLRVSNLSTNSHEV